MIGYAPGDALPARQAEKQYPPDFGEYFGNPCLASRMDDHAHRPMPIHGIEGALIES
jgi:hypothetical protein